MGEEWIDLAIRRAHCEVPAQALLSCQAVGQRVLWVSVCGVDFAHHAALELLLPDGDEDLQWEGGGWVVALLPDVDADQRGR